MKLSIIVPVYNLEKYILKCLNSLLISEFKHLYDIIIINDGSTDSSHEIINNFIYTNLYFDIKYRVVENGGVSKARNIGMQISNSEYILFIDGDDYLENTDLSKIIKIILNEDADIFYYAFKGIDEKGIKCSDYLEKFKELNDLSGQEAFKMKLTKQIWICQGTAVYKRTLVELNDIRFPVGYRMGEDIYFINTALINSKRVKFINDVYLNILERENSAMHESFNEKYFDPIILNSRLKNELIEKHVSDDVLEYLVIDDINFMTDYLKRYIYSLKFFEIFKIKKAHEKLNFADINLQLPIISRSKRLEFTIAKKFKYIYFIMTKIYKVKSNITKIKLSMKKE